MPSQPIAHETGLERKRVLRALTVLRQAIAAQQATVVRRRHAGDPHYTANGSHNGSAKPVIGLAIVHGRAAAETLPEPVAEEVRRAVRDRAKSSTIETPQEYDAVVYRGQFHRVTAANPGAPAGFGELEAFWAYLRHRLRSKGGIRRERLGLYLAEYAWRYNRRSATRSEQVEELLRLLQRSTRGQE